jgi:hypothetical protein
MMHSGNAGGNKQNITAGTNTTAAVTLALITVRGSTDRMRWHLHHRRMVLRTGVDILVITAGWYGWTGVDVLVITSGWYAGPALIFSSSQLDGTPVRRR